MIQRQWVFRGLEFRSLMRSVGRDRLPFPLQFRPLVASAEEYARQQHDAEVLAASALDGDLRISLRVLVNPTYRIEVVGHHRRRGSEPEKVRAHATVQHDVGVVLAQDPGVDDATGHDVTVTLVDSRHAARLVLGALPVCGSGDTSRLDVPRRQADSNEAMMRAATRTTDRERADQLLGRPQSSAGEILICRGASIDGRPDDTAAGFHWIDIDGDGRYIVRHGSIVSILPASPADLEREVRRAVDDVTR
ncbi:MULTISPECIES: ESX secretion-associated protein EspG [Nocardiaceae]|nr:MULTISPECIES: ESX secretion-associated protein EspG [Rhodococcus]